MRCFDLLLLFLVCGLIACSKESGSSTPNPSSTPVVQYQVQSIELTTLQIVDPTNTTGTPPTGLTVKTNFPSHLQFGVTQSGGVADTEVSFGLMEQLTAEQEAAARGLSRLDGNNERQLLVSALDGEREPHVRQVIADTLANPDTHGSASVDTLARNVQHEVNVAVRISLVQCLGQELKTNSEAKKALSAIYAKDSSVRVKQKIGEFLTADELF